MAPADTTAPADPMTGYPSRSAAPDASRAGQGTAANAARARADIAAPGGVPKKERFIPLTVAALVDRLAVPSAWPRGQARAARRLFRYLDYWRRQQYSASLIDLIQTYEPFSPDSDLLITREYTPAEREVMQGRVVADMAKLLEQANYERIDPADVSLIMTKETHYGLDLTVDFTAFEECLVYYRGASSRRDTRRNMRKFYRKEEFDVPIFQRLFLLFKLKPFETRVRELMVQQKLPRNEAEKAVKRLRSALPESVKDDLIYMKLFKNIPRSDMEMVFPNTQVRFRLHDKIKLGLTGGGAFGAGVFGTASKLAAGGLIATNPVALAGAVATLGGVAFRQAMNFVNQKNRYMVVMAQNLYFHSMADNRGVANILADRAAEEDVKEEILLYSVLCKESAKRADLPAIDAAIEQYLESSFGLTVDFDLEDALGRLIESGLVAEKPDGTLVALQPHEAAQLIDRKWDLILDELPDFGEAGEGREVASTVEPNEV